MPADWGAAAASIAAAFRDPEAITYTTKAGETFAGLPVVRSDATAPEFPGAGATLRKLTYELAYGLLPHRPKNGDTFTHRGRVWQVQNVTDMDDVGAWQLVVVNAGPIP